MNNDDAVVVDVFYPHPVQKVWQALTRSDAIEAWLMPNDFEPSLGRAFTFHTAPDQNWNGMVDCEVVALDEPRHLAYTWRNAATQLDTLVTFTLEPAEGGTNLRLEHTGFAKSGKAGQFAREGLGAGWSSTVLRVRLAGYLNGQPVPYGARGATRAA
jgi:uncharacterized protein YndB with AHSA1/START domain